MRAPQGAQLKSPAAHVDPARIFFVRAHRACALATLTSLRYAYRIEFATDAGKLAERSTSRTAQPINRSTLPSDRIRTHQSGAKQFADVDERARSQVDFDERGLRPRACRRTH